MSKPDIWLPADPRRRKFLNMTPDLVVDRAPTAWILVEVRWFRFAGGSRLHKHHKTHGNTFFATRAGALEEIRRLHRARDLLTAAPTQ